MSKDKVYARPLEDGSGYGVFFGSYLPSGGSFGGRDRWEKVLGVGKTKKDAWADYRNRARFA